MENISPCNLSSKWYKKSVSILLQDYNLLDNKSDANLKSLAVHPLVVRQSCSGFLKSSEKTSITFLFNSVAQLATGRNKYVSLIQSPQQPKHFFLSYHEH